MADAVQFKGLQDAYFDAEHGRVVHPGPAYSDLVEIPECGARVVNWRARLADGTEDSGTMLVSRHPHDTDVDARNVVAEMLWGRGYQGNYDIQVVAMYGTGKVKGETNASSAQ